MHWYKGSIHNHSDRSDGDASPAELTAWYKRHGYDFIILTDHNRVTPVEDINREFWRKGISSFFPARRFRTSIPAIRNRGPCMSTPWV